jgi:drug/metabolite transporter (DMT)-like permease
MSTKAILYALASAALFGAATPAAKALLGSIDPMVLAGLLYLGAGIGVAILRLKETSEARLSRAEVPCLAGAIFAGGVVGPALLMIGLVRTSGATASLLLSLEGVTTALLAWFVFRENFDRRIALGMVLLVAGGLLLAWSAQPTLDTFIGPLAIIGACFAWGVDNNLTRKVSLSDPLQIVQLKGLFAGPINLALGLLAGASIPAPATTLTAGIVGFLGYGLSLALFILALRHLGAARTGAYFSTAPFIGAIAAVAFLHEPLTTQLILAGVLMAAGVWLHVTEHHDHEHIHEAMEHEHAHTHDEHHQHEHAPDDPAGEPHTHVHRHGRLVHKHPHFPDMHHTHRH